ncbi:hypothetical protein NQ317_017121 [Molorchus minor]|uniref:Ankyrin repeat protein n=1 Tax=Molorchus minor TaxID=1323400 RepID=A0ABQ9JHJ3_9CUCU|nr:hypothetical protein NQ317_017121 [Molorchus minor]
MTENEENVKRKKNPVITDDDKNTKMHYFAAEGNISELTEEIKIYQKIDPENYLGWTPLLMACRNGHKAAVNLLLQHHADATKKNKFGMSVFLVSIASGDLELVHQILQHLLCGGVSRQSLQHIFSPISLAILFCHQHILQYLISQNFAINIATHITGVTPIMFAAAYGKL